MDMRVENEFLLQNAACGIGVVLNDERLTFSEANDYLRKILGIGFAAGKGLADALDRDVFESLKMKLDAAKTAEPVVTTVSVYRHSGGVYRYTASFNVCETGGKPAFVCAFVEQPKQDGSYELGRKGLHADEAALNAAFDITDETLYVSESFCELLGFPPEFKRCTRPAIERYLDIAVNKEQLYGFFDKITAKEPHGEAFACFGRKGTGSPRWYRLKYFIPGEYLTEEYAASGAHVIAQVSFIDFTDHYEFALARERWMSVENSLGTVYNEFYIFNLDQNSVITTDDETRDSLPPDLAVTFTNVRDFVCANSVHPDDREKYLSVMNAEYLRSMYSGGKPSVMFRQRRKLGAGDYTWVSVELWLYSDPYSGDLCFYVLIKDLDDVATIINYGVQRSMFDLINKSIAGGIVIVRNCDGYPITFVNDGMVTFLGCTRQRFEEEYKNLESFVSPDDWIVMAEVIREASPKRDDFRLTQRVLGGDGVYRWAVARGRVVSDEMGEESVYLMYVSVNDVVLMRDEIEAQAKVLAEKNTDLEQFSANMMGGVCILYFAKRCAPIYKNAYMNEMYGYPPDDDMEDVYDCCYTEEDVELMTYTAGEYLKDNTKRYFELELRPHRKDTGEPFWVLVRGSHTIRGGEVLLHCVITDITHMKNLEEQSLHRQMELESAVKTAEESTKSKSAFLANMSHEIRTPMNGVIGLAELALDDGSLSPKIRDFIAKIRVSATGLLEIINDILDISKIEAGKIELEKVPFDLRDVLKQCDDINSIRAEEKGLSLFFYSEPQINRLLVGDPTRLRQILLNLLSNAIKFTSHGMVKLMATVEQMSENTVTIKFEVKDSGIGMTKEQVAKIFEPYIQAETATSRNYGGTGLGLAITKNIVELMGGSLTVESTPGLGSVFSFIVTFESIDIPEESLDRRASSESVKRPVFNAKVLVCEDNYINQQVVREHMERMGLEVTIAENGKSGLAAYEESVRNRHPFDLIFMDVHMPIMDGLEAAQRLMKLGNKAPVIALTANNMTNDKENYLANGMADFISKPFSTSELATCLLKYLKPISTLNGADRVSLEKAHDKSRPAIKRREKPSPVESGGALNRQLGIERSAGDERVYKMIVTNFSKSNKNACDEIKLAIINGDIKAAHRTTHSLKGVAAMIGALQLSEAAKTVEQALLAEDLDTVNTAMPHLQASLNEVLGEISSYIAAKQEAKPKPKNDTLSKNRALELLDDVAPLLGSGDTKAVDMINEIEFVLAPIGEKARRFAKFITDYDFDGAFDMVEELREEINEY